jgi:hypothetical protein
MGEKTAARSTLQGRYREARKWAPKALAELQQEQADVGDANVVSSTSKLANATGPPIKPTMVAIDLQNGNRGCDNRGPYNYYVSDLSEGVVDDRHPAGKGAQLLTRMIEHLRNSGKSDLLLSEVSDYARKHSIVVSNADRCSNVIAADDKAALERHRDTIGKFYTDRFGHPPK